MRYISEENWPAFDLDRDGHLQIPSAPGLGVEINWAEVLRAAEQGVSWRDEKMYLGDGTSSNW